MQLTQLAYFDELRAGAPRDLSEVAKRLGLSLRSVSTLNKKFKDAIELCERLVQDPTSLDRTGATWFNLASASNSVGDYPRALEAVDEYLKHQPHKQKARALREEILQNLESPPPNLPPEGAGN